MLTHRIIRGVSLAFEWFPAGKELIVFLHGVGADRTAWEPQAEFFHQHGYSVAAIDMRGTGESQSRDERGRALPITIADFAADVHELILHLGFERAHWVGNSMGGVIIMEGFRQQCSTISKAVLANTFAKYPDSHLLLPRPAQALKTKSLAEFAAERIPFAHRPKIGDEILQASIRAMATKDVETYLLSWRETWSHDYRAELPQLGKTRGSNVLVITGSLDTITPPTLGLALAHLIPGSQYHEIKNAGHISNLDQPDEFNHVALEFLKT